MRKKTAAKPLPDAEYLRARLAYDPETGELRWKQRPLEDFADQHQCNAVNARLAGKPAGTRDKLGYLHVRVQSHRILAHRIIWKIVTGRDPIAGIDHRDTDPTNNRFDNLREADQARNNQNARKRASASGLKGAKLTNTRLGPRFDARICREGKTVHLGRFLTAEDAHQAYCAAAKTERGEFFNPG